jgi:hypothetical protein
MRPLAALAPADVRDAMLTYRDVLRTHQQAVNALNVYPVPDGDTGTNMALTLEAVAAELDTLGAGAPMADVCKAVSHGSLMGARGNSGVILSQLLRGVAERWSGCETVGPLDVAEALVTASDLARRAVVRPVEGTILTVARAVGEGAGRLGAPGDLVGTLEAARVAGADALARTPEMLDVLKRAGVVDAGGSGYLLFVDALLTVADRRALPDPPADAGLRGPVPAPTAAAGHPSGVGGVADLRYEVMYLLEAPDEAIEAFREVWAGIGDSIVVVGGEGLWQCHIHTDDVGAAIEVALDAGRPSSIRVTDLHEQVEEERWVREASAEAAGGGAPRPAATPPRTGVVAVTTGDGIGRIFRSLGVHHQVPGGQSANPSTAELLAAVEAAGSPGVVILPNNKNVVPVAGQVDRLATASVGVVPTGSVVEGFAALLAYDPGSSLQDNLTAMAASSVRVVPAEVTVAVRDAQTDAGPVHAGDWIGLSREGVVSVGPTAAAVACGLLDRLVGPTHELVTLIEGEGATPADTRRISEWLHDERPAVAIEVHHGGQPLYPYLLGIE